MLFVTIDIAHTLASGEYGEVVFWTAIRIHMLIPGYLRTRANHEVGLCLANHHDEQLGQVMQTRGSNAICSIFRPLKEVRGL